MRSYPSAATGSAAQFNEDGVVVHGVLAGSSSPLNTQLNVLTQTCGSQGTSCSTTSNRTYDGHLNRSRPASSSPDYFAFCPVTTQATLTVALMSIILGARISAEIILEESAAQPSLIFMGRDVMILEDRVLHLLRGSGTDPVVYK